MRRTIIPRPAVTVFVVAALVASAQAVGNSAPGDQTLAGAVVWYVPIEEDFRAEYERDVANQAKQSWEDYWGWVVSFYKGNFLATGWDERARTTAACVQAEERKTVVRVKLNAIGRVMCREWAKDSGVRKVSSSDLIRWGKEIEKARERDRGQGDVLEKELERISGEVKRKMRGSS